jgi:hypothetical protein
MLETGRQKSGDRSRKSEEGNGLAPDFGLPNSGFLRIIDQIVRMTIFDFYIYYICRGDGKF